MGVAERPERLVNWLALISAVLGALKALTEWLHDRQLIDAGTAEAMLAGYKSSDVAIARAQKARDLVDAAIARSGDPRLHDDGFRRRD